MFIREYGSGQVAHDLMHVNQNLPIRLRVKRNRLNVGIDFGPLLRPVSADFLRAMNKAAFKGFGPSYSRRHGGQGGLDVSGVESGVGRTQQLDLRFRLI